MEWYINKGAKNCSSCERFFKEEEEYFSALYDKDNDFTRRDFCLECWNKARGGGIFSYWKTKVQKTSDTVPKYADIDVFYDLFQRLENESNLSSVNFRYVLSLYLMRKKILKLKATHRTNGSEILVFQNFKEDKETKVFKPHLGREEILAVTEEIGKLLNCTAQI
ncbi:hypothetical protein LCGC14_1199710 [marine sediment metagenome]|uniref:Uncharacterized protein n=1 Tax=marine sediment metagenome TaxID=412755 RepID=A0A0F9LHC1_9ZZZZ|nr:hypothetical protein [Candidatus Scalindua sediminis]HDY67436.1 hypothetical protein [Candidatus Scalindua sp.]